MQSLAQEATSNTVPNIATVNSTFQQLLNQVNKQATGTTFNGASLLTGAFLADTSASGDGLGSALSLPNLTASGIFRLTESRPPDAAKRAGDRCGAYDRAVDRDGYRLCHRTLLLSQQAFTSATVDTALNNQAASTSTLSESDHGG